MTFLDVTPKSQATKEKINKLDSEHLKSLCTQKTSINRVKRKQNEKKISVHHVSDKGLISRIYKELKIVNNNKKNTWFKNGQRT